MPLWLNVAVAVVSTVVAVGVVAYLIDRFNHS